MQILAAYYLIHHRPNFPYEPWANGTVESLNWDFFAVLRSILAELKIIPYDWPCVVGAAQKHSEQSTDSALANKLKQVAPHSTAGHDRYWASSHSKIYVYANRLGIERKLTLEWARAEKFVTAKQLKIEKDSMQKNVHERISKWSHKEIDAHNRAENYCLAKFSIRRLFCCSLWEAKK